MRLYRAEIVADENNDAVVDVHASSMRVAFTKAARHCKMRNWAKIKITFVRTINYVWILTRLDPDPGNPASKTRRDHREFGEFPSSPAAMQHVSTVLGISTDSPHFGDYWPKRVIK